LKIVIDGRILKRSKKMNRCKECGLDEQGCGCGNGFVKEGMDKYKIDRLLSIYFGLTNEERLEFTHCIKAIEETKEEEEKPHSCEWNCPCLVSGVFCPKNRRGDCYYCNLSIDDWNNVLPRRWS
jgi:hypothetical protein